MTSQPLETIPEEPTPTPTQTPARVTDEPPKTKPAAKNPGRVASGKRLAERNRLAREAMKKKAAEAAATTTAASASDDTEVSGGSSLSLGAVLGIGGLIVSAAGLYYQREAIMTRLKPAPPPPEPAKPAEPAPSRIPVRGIKKME